MRKKLKLAAAAAAAAAAQSSGSLPTPQHNNLWNSPVLSFDNSDMVTYFLVCIPCVLVTHEILIMMTFKSLMVVVLEDDAHS